MILLAPSATLAGGADVASKVTITVTGMELTSGTEAYKTLYQRQLGNSLATIYTAGGSTQVFIKGIHVVNTDTVARTFTLAVGGTAAANQITPTITLQAGGFAIYVDGVGWQVFTKYGAVLQTPYMTVPTVDNWASASAIAATHDRNLITETNTTLITTGQVYMQAIWLTAGQVVSAIRIWSATTAASGPTHYNAGLYDTSGNRLATSTDKTSTAWAANTMTSFSMQSPYTVPTSGLYYVAFGMTVSTTVPTIKGSTARVDGAIALATPPISGVSATAYSSGDMPVTLAVPAAKVLTSMYAEVA